MHILYIQYTYMLRKFSTYIHVIYNIVHLANVKRENENLIREPFQLILAIVWTRAMSQELQGKEVSREKFLRHLILFSLTVYEPKPII